jgi:RNA polymerase sigma factor for flagellar operon FliA
LRDRVESIGEGFTKNQDARLFKDMVQAAIGLAFGYLLEDAQLNTAPEGQQDNPYKQLEVNRLKARLQAIVDRLPEKEGIVIRYHYFEHHNFSEIATLMKLTKGRVSQLHSRALVMIREAYEEADNFNVSY